MSVLNAVVGGAVGGLLRPLEAVSPLVGLALVSLLSAILALLVFKTTSNQTALLAVKRQIHACLFEIRLYNDDFPAILRAQAEALGWNLRYLAYSLVPLAVMLVLLLPMMSQLQGFYGYRGLAPGEAALVKVELKEDHASKPAASLGAPGGLRVETPPLWIPEQRELAWRVRADRAGSYDVRIAVGDDVVTKSVVVSRAVTQVSPLRVARGWLAQLLNPVEPPVPDSSPVHAIALTYPERDIEIFGLGMHWMVVFFVLVLAFAYLLRGPMRVTI